MPGSGTLGMSYLLPGIRRLNTIRNRLAHNLSADVTADDANIFQGIELFRAMREERKKPDQPSVEAIDILEDFAKHAGIALHASATRNGELWEKAFRLADQEELEAEHETTT